MGNIVYSQTSKSLREIIEESQIYLGSTSQSKDVDVTKLIQEIGNKIKEILLRNGGDNELLTYSTKEGCNIDNLVKLITEDA